MAIHRKSWRNLPGGRAASVLVAACTVMVVVACGVPAPTPTTRPSVTTGTVTSNCDAFRDNQPATFYPDNGLAFEDTSELGWSTGTPKEVGLDSALLAHAAENAALSSDLRGLLVVRHGRLVFERYFNGSDSGRAGTIASASKSILSVATGIAIDEGLLSLDTRLDAVLPADVVGAHGDLTIEHLLTMSGGLENSKDNDYLADVDENALPNGFSFPRQVLKWDSAVPAGTEFAYSTGLTQVLASVLSEVTGQSACAYVTERLLGPLGIDVEDWWVEPDGVFAGGHSIFITARELARFGQFVLQGGEWNGTQIVSADWLDRSTSQRWDLGCRPAIGADIGYGFLWWVNDADGHEVWNASGYGGQDVWIAPDLDLVVVTTHDTTRAEDPTYDQVLPSAIARAAIFPATEAPRPPVCPGRHLIAETIRPDGTGRSAVDSWPVNGLPMSWSPDGSRLAIQLDRLDLNAEIYTIAPDGSGLQRLTFDLAPDGLPAYSPDGTRVVFTRGRPGSSDVFLVGSDGDGLAQLTDLDGHANTPTWSADGTRIAFVWGEGDAGGFGADGALWSIDVDGTGLTRLLDRSIGYPAWSPDGSRIALELRGENHVGVLDLATGEVADLGPGFVPKWSPDGSRLTFLRGVDGAIDIYVMDADGSNVIRLTNDAAFNTFPLWSPDGKTILFLTDMAG